MTNSPTPASCASNGNGRADILLGLQWGDEGKGKVVDVLTPRYSTVARFQGGPNAGHTIHFDGGKHVLRSVPSGIFQDSTLNVIGNGVVLDPQLFAREARELEALGVDIKNRLHIARKAHLILPTHRLLDAANERMKGSSKIGTTGKGIGPAYTDKVNRSGLRVGDLTNNFHAKYAAARERHLNMLASMGFAVPASFADEEKAWLQAVEYLREFTLIDAEHVVNERLDRGMSLLCEGAQGTMLDIDFGSYPFVTSSNTVAAGACTGLGLAPRRVGDVYGIMKAYCTRVGAGPFPTELFDETGKRIRDIGHEYGAVTGRERRCGWLDLVALRYAVKINGVTKLILMKSDVLDGFDEICVANSYIVDGKEVTDFPWDLTDAKIEPVLTRLPGWEKPVAGLRDAADLPDGFRKYVAFIEKSLGAPVTIVSTGPDRADTIFL